MDIAGTTRWAITRLVAVIGIVAVSALSVAGSYQMQSMTGGLATEGLVTTTTYQYVQSGGTRGLSQTDPEEPLNMSGAITATFEWVADPNDPNDTPPTAVIAIETTSASVNAAYPPGSPAAVTVDDGIDSPVTVTKPYQKTLNGQRVTTKSGSKIVLTCEPL